MRGQRSEVSSQRSAVRGQPRTLITRHSSLRVSAVQSNRPLKSHIAISIIAPAHNEEENIAPLVREIDAVIARLGLSYELIIINDGSTDRTLEELRAMVSDSPALRVLTMKNCPSGRGHGQSAAFAAGIRAARGDLIAMLDADLQNDPGDIPKMLELMERTDAHMIQGDRTGVRRDTALRRVSSVVSRWFRRVLLADSIRDCACSTRLIRRDVALRLPLEFRGQHRFMPITVRDLGLRVVEMPVSHRPRIAGKAKYGVWNRALPGLIDCFAVRWMRRRRCPVEYDVVGPPAQVSKGRREAASMRPPETLVP